MEKKIYFDMDGTIADLYGVDGWLEQLRLFNHLPYVNARPMVDITRFVDLLYQAEINGWKIGIISWLSLDNNKEFNKRTRIAKRDWLRNTIPFNFGDIHFVKYGTPKHYIGEGILVDDNDKILKAWSKGDNIAIDAKLPDWMNTLEKIVRGE